MQHFFKYSHNMEKYIFYKCLVFRLFSIIAIQTYFVADEYWQSLEVGHALSFGYGYYTWEYTEEIRSMAYPAIFAFLYKVLELLRIDFPLLVVYVPKLFQAVLSAFGDYYFIQLCNSFNLNKKDIWCSVFFDWFGFFCGSRTIINTFELNLITFGLYVFPWHSLSSAKKIPISKEFGLLVFFVCYVRPTAILIWGPFLTMWLINCHHITLRAVIKELILAFCIVTIFCFAMDSIFYGRLSLTPFNFLYFNIYKGIASFYGSHPFYWYFTQGIPVVLGLFIVPLCIQVYATFKTFFNGGDKVGSMHYVNMLLMPSTLLSLCLLSFVKHKEFRFILPLMPMMKIICIQGNSVLRRRKYYQIFQILLLLGFFVPSVLFGQFHQRGTLSVMETLKREIITKHDNTSILIVTPCHATPLFSHLHHNVPVRFITCEPPITSQHIDESEIFFDDPLLWLQTYFVSNKNKLPTHIVMFDNLVKPLNDFLIKYKYKISHTLFHTLFPDGRIGRNVVVYNLIL